MLLASLGDLLSREAVNVRDFRDGKSQTLMNAFRLKAVAILAAVFALVLAPIGANAYTPTAPDGGERTVAPAASFTVTFTGFEPGESVAVTMTGPDGANGQLAFIRTAVSTATLNKAANGAGDVPVNVTLPASSQDGDVYELVATGERSGAATYTIYVVEDASNGDGDDSDSDSGSGGSLPKVGSAASVSVIAVGGIMLLAGAGILFAARRQRDS